MEYKHAKQETSGYTREISQVYEIVNVDNIDIDPTFVHKYGSGNTKQRMSSIQIVYDR